MEFVGKAGESGGGMFVVSILFFYFEEAFDSADKTILTQNVDNFPDVCLRSTQSSGQSGSSYP